MMEKAKRNRGISKLIRQVVTASPVLFLGNYGAAALNGFLSAQAVIWLQKLFDAIAVMGEVSRQGLWEVIRLVLLFLLIRIGAEISVAVYNMLGDVLSMIAMKEMGGGINRKNGNLEPVDFENPDKLDLIESAYRGSSMGRDFVNAAATILFLDLPYYGTLIRFLYGVKPAIPLILLFLFVPALLMEWFQKRYYVELEKESAALQRKMTNYAACAAGKETVQESRQFGAVSFFVRRFHQATEQLTRKEISVETRNARIAAALRIFHYAGYVATLAMLGYYLYQGEIAVGLFASVFCSLDTIFAMMQDTIHENISQAIRIYGKVSGYLRYQELPEKKQGGQRSGHDTITLKNVSFAYPGSSSWALQDVSLTINKGETVAIVGENGSGKTTLVRLMAGIYLPRKGAVLHNQMDLRDCDRQKNYEGISGVFQQFGKYRMTVRENVEIASAGKPEGKKAGCPEGFWEEKMAKALKQADFDMSALPDGWDTMLAKEYGGTELSGGQWQRLAIARGICRDSRLIFLDEPTAAIDPKEERRIYEEFERLTRDKTAVIVTHRLASVQMADQIVVMDRGRLVAAGAHQQLLEGCPLYRKMWYTQLEQYQ